MTLAYSLITRRDLVEAANQLNVSLPVIRAVAAVEGRNTGFIKQSDLPVILFEGHYFSRLTGGVYDSQAPTISYPKWTKQHYLGGKGEYRRLMRAIEVNDGNPDPALQSTSWGMFQIMGANFEAAGFETVQDFVNWIATGENYHLRAFVNFIRNKGLADSLRGQRWAAFAEAYNGPRFRENKYDTKLAQEFTEHRRRLQAEDAGEGLDLERGDVLRLQAALNTVLKSKLSLDGWVGDKTIGAVRQAQAHFGLEPSGEIDQALCDALELDMSHYLKSQAT